ncbi:hypothetical protein ACHAO7_009715 [Fusarium culmorum]
MAASSKPGSPRARARKIKSQPTRISQKSDSSSPLPSPAISDTSSTKAVYETPASSFSELERDAFKLGSSTSTGIPGRDSPPPSNVGKDKLCDRPSSCSSNKETSSYEEGPGSSSGKSGVREGKKLQIPEDPGIRSTGTNDLLQWLKDATAELEISRLWETIFQSFHEKLSEEIRMRCRAEEQLKFVSVTLEKEEALREHSKLKAHTQVLEEKLKTSQDEFKKLQETQDARLVLLPEYQGVRECFNKDVQEQGRPPKDIGDVLNEREIYLTNMWDEAAEQREAAMDQATVYERDMNVAMQKKDQLEIEKAELVERLERVKSNAFTQKLDLEKAEKESKQHERESAILKQENAELLKQLEAYKSESAKEQASQRDATTQTELAIETIATPTEGNLGTFLDLATETTSDAATRENDEALDEVKVYEEEEDQEDHPDEADEPHEDNQQSEADKEQELLEHDATLKRSQGKHERLMATENDVAPDGDAEPDKTEKQDTNEQQNTNIPSAEEDRTVTGSPVRMVLAAQQDVAPAESVPEPSIVAVTPSSQRRRGNKISKGHKHKHRPKEDQESRQQKDARRRHRSDNNKKRHEPTSETRQIKKKERGPTRRAWVRCLKHPASALLTYFNLNGILSRQFMKRCHRRIY